MASLISRGLSRAPAPLFSAYCMAAAFGTYFCMYAYRKPFTAGKFVDEGLWGLDLKAVLVIAQTFGYMLSKFIGIKVVSEMRPERRAIAILLMIAVAHAALLFFAVLPPPWNVACLFLNGLPLGMVFGLVLGFLEGRRLTEMLAVGLCASFILSSGVVKSVGKWLLGDGVVTWSGQTLVDLHCNEYWMPFITGVLFWPLLLLSVWLLAQIPAPTVADVLDRSERAPIDRAGRAAVFRRHWLGLSVLIAVYTGLSILRSVRDDFAVEIWEELGYKDQADVFTTSETWVMFVVLAINGASVLIRDNRRAFQLALMLITVGLMVVVGGASLHQSNQLSPYWFMVLAGMGLYVPYVVFNMTLFERMIAVFRDRANMGYLMYLADSIGYLGYVALLLCQYTGKLPDSYLRLYLACAYIAGGISLALMVISLIYYVPQMRRAVRD